MILPIILLPCFFTRLIISAVNSTLLKMLSIKNTSIFSAICAFWLLTQKSIKNGHTPQYYLQQLPNPHNYPLVHIFNKRIDNEPVPVMPVISWNKLFVNVPFKISPLGIEFWDKKCTTVKMMHSAWLIYIEIKAFNPSVKNSFSVWNKSLFIS